ncbi:alpha/beta fold hydrolase [Mycetocola zhadangensis]|uniref:Alpha/beta hydrolase n=1 Tax=Mycetocola zhadangensis TaxID=1164595 RepID=A0A3L7IS97_9MICO|nr:alpha/beta fold hydrolase [Mycetocola zhadangensis]RLQ81098.1 alpha/beta hydrolase [Mycetocola zhadangensis]GGF04758.1 alpha/beta hydrolase [Mycetocola zhadangensis]
MRTVESPDGTKIACETHGAGPALIFVDGALCWRDAGPMRPLANELSSGFTVTLYDRRGRGASGNTLPWSAEREVEDLAAVIDAVGGSAALYAVSSGAALALAAAAELGERISALVIFEPPYLGPDGREDALAYTAKLSRLLDEGKRGDAVELFLTRVGVPAQAVAGMRSSPGWSASEALAPTLAYDNAFMGDGTLPIDLLGRVTQQTLVVDGGAVPFMSTAARNLADALSAGTHHSIGGQGHDVAPEVIAPVIAEFLTGVVPAPSQPPAR